MTQSDATSRFSTRARDYAAGRPTYPEAAIDACLEDLPPPDRTTAADVGAGTGIASRLLAERGCRVLAIEPNADMRAAAPENPRITWLDATAEQTSLDDDSIDLLLCAQTFHWLDADRALAEFARILRPAGRVALLWNVHDTGDAFTRDYRDTILRHATDPPRSPWHTNEPCPLADSPLFTGYELRRFENFQPLDIDTLHKRALSSSYLPNEGPRRDALIADLDAIFTRYARAGMVALRYNTELHTARAAP